MSDRQPKKNAFTSPSAAAKQRLGNRALSPSRSDASSSVYSRTSSRRSISMIASTEDVETFDQMSASTGVSVGKKKKAKPNPVCSETMDEMYESASGTMDEFVGGAVNMMRSFSPVSQDDSNIMHAGHSFGSGSTSQANLDLRNNDNSFHVLASLLVEFFQAKVVGQTLTLLPEDRGSVERLLPESARLPFIEAVRYRLELTPMVAVTPIQFLTLQCQELGLDKDTANENPILAVASLDSDPVALQVLSVLSGKQESHVSTVDTTAEEQLGQKEEVTKPAVVDDDDEDELDDEDFAFARSHTEDDGSEPESDNSEEFVVDMKVSSSSSSDESIIKIVSSQDVADAMRAEEEEEDDATEEADETEVKSSPSEDDSMPTDGEDPEDYETDGVDQEPVTDADDASVVHETDEDLEIAEKETDADEELKEKPSKIETLEAENGNVISGDVDRDLVTPRSETKKNTAGGSGNEIRCGIQRKSKICDEKEAAVPKTTAVIPHPEGGQQHETRNNASGLQAKCERELAFDEKVDMKIYKAKMAAEDLANRMSIAAGLFVSDVRSVVETQVNNIQDNIQLHPLSDSFESQSANQHPPRSFVSEFRSTVETQVHNIQNSISPRSQQKEPGNQSVDRESKEPTQQPGPINPFLQNDSKMTAEAIRDREILAFDTSKFEGIDNLAVKQLLAELREASNLMAHSETPDTTGFWREHVLSLQSRLEVLFDELPTFERIQAQLKVPPNEMPTHVPQATAQARPRTSDDREVMLKVDQGNFYESPPEKTSKEVPAPSETNPRTADQPHAESLQKKSEYDVPMVDVVSPADLPAGYQFEAEIEGQRFLAIVPKGGVEQGETFTCYMRELDSVAIDIPVGYWKDGLCNAFKYGCCHTVICNALLCPLVALGQIQTRVNLDFLGRPRFGTSALSNRFMMISIVVFWALTNIGIFVGCNLKWSRGMELSLADLCAFALINITMLGFIVFVTQSTRSSLRERFMIREDRCSDLEDICCACICLPCTICQMSRHTANYDDYEAVCCSKTGLPDGVRVNQVPTKESDGYVV